MSYINEQLKEFKKIIESAIIKNGEKGKTSAIRSSKLINLIHDAVKYELINHGVDSQCVFPHLNKSKPEIKLAGQLKQKDQDICVVPKMIEKTPSIITWGPLSYQKEKDPYGFEYSNNTLVVNVRSQMSSLDKNSDTLFERTFAEALNLHMRYPDMVLGEVYLIPTHAYDDALVKEKKVAFKTKSVNIEKYISFFNAINNRKIGDEYYSYERCALLIVDFNNEVPKLYSNNDELIKDNLISKDFSIDYSTLSFDSFAKDIIDIYSHRFDFSNISK